MSNSTTTIVNFKLQTAPGAVETFSLPAILSNNRHRHHSESEIQIPDLESKLGELGLNLENVYLKNRKGALVPLSRSARNIRGNDEVKLFAITDSEDEEEEDSSDSSSGEDDEEVVNIDPRRKRRCGFGRRESRSRSRDHSRSRDCPMKRKHFMKHLAKRVHHLERASGGHPVHRRAPGFDFPGFGGCRGRGGRGGFGGPGRCGGFGGFGRHGGFGGHPQASGFGGFGGRGGFGGPGKCGGRGGFRGFGGFGRHGGFGGHPGFERGPQASGFGGPAPEFFGRRGAFERSGYMSS